MSNESRRPTRGLAHRWHRPLVVPGTLRGGRSFTSLCSSYYAALGREGYSGSACGGSSAGEIAMGG